MTELLEPHLADPQEIVRALQEDSEARRRDNGKLYDLTPPPKTTMGRFQQGVANERYALVATPAGAAYLNYNSNNVRIG